MKQVIQKPESRSVITTNEIDENKFFGVSFTTLTIKSHEKYILQKRDGIVTNFVLYGLNYFTIQSEGKVVYFNSIAEAIDNLVSSGHKVYQFDTLSELAKWMENN